MWMSGAQGGFEIAEGGDQDTDVPDRFRLNYFNQQDLDLISDFSMFSDGEIGSHFTSTSRHELEGHYPTV